MDLEEYDLNSFATNSETKSGAYIVLLIGLSLSAALMASVVLPTSTRIHRTSTDSGNYGSLYSTSSAPRVATEMTVDSVNSYVDELFRRVSDSLVKQGAYKYKYLMRASHNDWFEVTKVRLYETHHIQRSQDAMLFVKEKPCRVVVTFKLDKVEMKGRRLSIYGNEISCLVGYALMNVTLLSDTKSISGGNMRVKNGELKVIDVSNIECRTHESLDPYAEEEVLEFLRETSRKYIAVFTKERLYKTLFHYVPHVAKEFGSPVQ